MDVPTDQTTGTVTHRIPPGTTRRGRRRRPTGEAPPLPHHLQTSGVGWLIVAIVLLVLTIVIFSRGLDGPAVAVAVADSAVAKWLASADVPGLVGLERVLAAISSWWVLNGLLVALVVALLVLRRFRHLIVFLILIQLLTLVAESMVGPMAERPRPFGVVIQAGWGGWALPSLQVMFVALALVTILYTLVPEGRLRNAGKWVATALIALTAIARVALGADSATDVLVGVVLGVALPLLAYRLFTPSEAFPVNYRRGRSAHLDVSGTRGQAIRKGLEDQLDLNVAKIKPFGLAGSAGSTPLKITLAGEPATVLFGKLYAKNHLRADRWYKLGRELLYGRLEDEKPYNTVRRLVQQEDYALRVCRDAGLASPIPYGFVELTPEREYLLVTEFFDGAVELGEADVDTQVIDDGLGIIRRLWDAGLAHRDIKPANLLVRDHHMLLIDVAFVEARPSPWRQAVDLANMMLCLALRSDAKLVYERALLQFSVEEISEGFAAARGLALPSQLRRMLRAQGRDLHAAFTELLPNPPQPIRIQRWSPQRVGLWALIALIVAFVGATVEDNISNNEANRTPLHVGNVSCTHLEPLWLQAQSVPSASMVPCTRILPAGWSLSQVTVNDGRTVLSFNNDRAGPNAMVVRLSATCDTRGATQVPSDRPGARRYVLIQAVEPRFLATRFDAFQGGCVTTRFSAPADRRAELTAEATLLLDLTTRQALQQALDRRSDGRLELNPEGGR
jgi:tRNA A-37 threonylcarbamoyl transferase component Bud32/membrane-associated phospholipid phosphatase